MKSISAKKLAKVLEKNGWTLVDINGSHFKYSKENKIVILPIHANRDMRIGTLKSVMKQANLTEEDLL